jgi:hypothetical protein
MTIEKMWNELKADERKRLEPVILHADKLARLASPSAKQCLEIYSKPTTVDRYTGKASFIAYVFCSSKYIGRST